MKPLRVCLAIPTFERLGAQRVAIWLAQGMDRARVQPSFLVHQRIGDLAADVPADVPVVEVDPLSLRVPRVMSLTRLRGYAKALERHPCDVALGIVQYPTLALAHVRRRTKGRWALLACEHSFVSKNLVDPEAYTPAFRAYYRLRLKRAYNVDCDGVVMTAEEGKDDLAARFGVRREKIHVVANPIDTARVRRVAAEPVDHPWFPADGAAPPVIVAAGRLVVQKRFDLLIDAFDRLRRRHAARLLILGAGQQDAALREQVRRLELGDLVRIEDRSPPWGYMSRARLVALSSEWEGFPMVLAEAMALGASIVSFACPSGPREMLRDGEAGILVPPGDPDTLADGLARGLTSSREDDDARRAKARRFAEEYDIARVCERYMELFERIAWERRSAA